LNDKYRVNSHMRNRPGRIFYMLDFKGLDAAFIEEYCNDRLNNKAHIPQIVRLTMMFDSFNFDMLKALIEEMNRYNESPNQAMEMLNARPVDAGTVKHHVSVFVEGKEINSDHVWPSVIRGNPISQDELNFRIDTHPDDADADTTTLEVTPEHLRKIDPETGTFTYIVNEGRPGMTTLVFTREDQYKISPYNYMNAI